MPRNARSTAVQATEAVPKSVAGRIHIVRGLRVMTDADLAELYGVTTKAINQAVARNRPRFPRDFAFRLTRREATNLRSQIVTSSSHGGRRYLPRAFTEHGVAMLSSVLRSQRAVSVNEAIMRAFVRLREVALSHVELTARITELERKYDGQFTTLFGAIRRLLASPDSDDDEPRRRIGFVVDGRSETSARARTHR